MTDKPFSESCERNKAPILEILRRTFDHPGTVLEIGSGTGQHAVHFSAALPYLTWQTSDLSANHAGIQAWLDETALANTQSPLNLDVSGVWPDTSFDYVFSANTLHIMGWPEVGHFFAGVGQVLKPGGRIAVYGPFNYGGRYTSESNERFDEWLKNRNPVSGIRNFEDVEHLAVAAGLQLLADHAMPANNRILVWEKRKS